MSWICALKIVIGKLPSRLLKNVDSRLYKECGSINAGPAWLVRLVLHLQANLIYCIIYFFKSCFNLISKSCFSKGIFFLRKKCLVTYSYFVTKLKRSKLCNTMRTECHDNIYNIYVVQGWIFLLMFCQN